MNEDRPLYHWKWLYRKEDISETDFVWTTATDQDEAIEEANRLKPGARIMRLVDLIQAKGMK